MSAGSILSCASGLDWHPVWLSFRVAGLATAISVSLGTLAGFALARSPRRVARISESAILLPLVLPPTVLGYYLLVAIGRHSPVGEFWERVTGHPLVFTSNAAVLAACVSAFPLVARISKGAFASLSRESAEAARIDGASFWRLFWDVELPQIWPSIAAAAALAFARAVGDFGTTLMVAGSIPGETRTASIAIYDLMNAGKDREAMVMAVLISVLSVTVVLAAQWRRPGSDPAV